MNPAVISVFLFCVLILTVIVRTFLCREKLLEGMKFPDVEFDTATAAERLSGAIKIPTIAYDDKTKTDMAVFQQFINYLEKAYPVAHQNLTKEVINGLSLLYHWKGSSGDKKPALFCAHIDVVPIEEGTESDWEYPPFSGEVTEDAVWGRGTQDIKIQLITLFEAAEALIKKGITPERDIYFAFGHDEETRRNDGADMIARHLKQKGLSFEYILDEGGCVIDNGIKGIERPVAFIGIAEKGFVNIRLTASGEGGHSSMPPEHTASGLVSRAVYMIESKRPSLKLTGAVKEMLGSLAPAMGFGSRMILSNLWLFSPLFKSIFSKTPSGSAFLRTTLASTMLEGSGAPNVLPLHAEAVINARILHGESSDSLKSRLEKMINDKNISIEMNTVYEPSIISPVDSFGFSCIAGAVRTLWPEAVVSPYLVVGGTDARKYEGLSDCIYRFSPYRVDNSEMKQMHGTNEHISIENIKNCVKYYTALFTI
ncbi:MAG TPA: M20 family peptidase [Spirochaetota bacterium]|nr:M20 family peptidase [Spirochaetota bacterium]HPJ34370.1 M20 family peptidase [Spirochaetota bacterium]